MFYVKKLDPSGEIVALVTYDKKPVIKNPLTIEISEEEFVTLLQELTQEESEEQTEEILQ